MARSASAACATGVRDGGPSSWRPRKGRDPRKLAPGRAGVPQAGAREGTGRLVHGPGRLWPWPRRPGVRGEGGGILAGVGRGRHEMRTGGSPDCDRGGTWSRRAWELHASARVAQQSRTRYVTQGPYRGPNTRSVIPGADPGPGNRPKLHGSRAFGASSSPIGRGVASLTTGPHVSPTSAPSPRHPPGDAPHESPTSSRPCARCFTNTSRPGRLMGVTACQDPHEAPRTPCTHLGQPPTPRTPAEIRQARLPVIA
jgi:hypothetical protein